MRVSLLERAIAAIMMSAKSNIAPLDFSSWNICAAFSELLENLLKYLNLDKPLFKSP